MPKIAFRLWGSLARFCLMVVSVIDSISPPPNMGVGMRKMILFVFEKLGWLMAHPAGASGRPTMVNISCTPPSGEPFGLLTNLTSRTGPLMLRKDGSVFPGAILLRFATCGLMAGLDPPTAGCAWQPPQDLRLKRGPSPLDTASTSLKTGTP